MKSILKFLVIAIMCLPVYASASSIDGFELDAKENVSSDNLVNGSSVLAGNNISAKNTVEGIGMLFGNNVNFEGTTDYSLIFANNVNLKGVINNEGFIFGNIIGADETLKISRDTFVFGNEISLNGEFGRDVTVYGSKVIIEGTIKGNINIYASSVIVKENTKIEGTLTYNEDAEKNISSAASIGEIKTSPKMINEVAFFDALMNKLYNLMGTLLVFLAFALITPKLFKMIDKKAEGLTPFKLVSFIGYGAITLVLIPVVIVILFTLIFGVPLALILLAIYLMCLYLTTILTGYLLGSIIWKKFIKKEKNPLLIGLVGIIFVYLLQLIPYIKTFIVITIMLIGIGIIINIFKKD